MLKKSLKNKRKSLLSEGFFYAELRLALILPNRDRITSFS